MKRKSLAVLVVLLLVFGMAVGVQAENAEDAVFISGNWRYRVRSDGNLEIVKWNGKESELVIPETIDGKKVVAIGDRAFWGCYSLTSIKIPDSVTSIGGNPFVGCDALQIDISPDHPTIALIDNALFYKPEKRLVTYLESSKAETYTIPQGILSIGDAAFGLCDSLTSVTIPDSVTSIGDAAFEDCDSLTSITIPGSVTSIGDHAFWGCYSLTSVTIPGSVTSIGDAAFWGCYSLTSIKIPDSVTSIGGNPFGGCDALQIDISPDHPTIALIDNALFYKPEKRLVTYLESSKAETYTIPQGILSIGDAAFGLCDSLTSITIPDSVTSIGDAAFGGCDSLTSITIPDSVTSIGDYAFYRCRNLTSVTIPGSVTSIGDDAFFDCPDTLQLIVDRDSYAKEYAKENNLSYNYPDALDWLAP